MNKSVMVAMSGGVDSSVVAVLLKEQGYSMCGATLKLFGNDDIGIKDRTKSCCALDDVEDARRVAYSLGIEYFVFNFADKFKKEVINRFASSYATGNTPNPCIDCNRYIKFHKMLERANLLGYNFIATGHYGIIERDKQSGRFILKKAKDESKDQSYVLYSMTQYELEHTLLPLGGMLKSDVRDIADRHMLVNAKKPDSQDICFVKDGDYSGFLKNVMNVEPIPGDFVDINGNFMGRHEGIIHYTVGQRKGLGINSSIPLYVISKDETTNTVVLGRDDDLYDDELIATDVNLISIANLEGPLRVQAKIRYKQKAVDAVISPLEDGCIMVKFDEKQRAITRGQAVVFYNDDIVVGGGTILK